MRGIVNLLIVILIIYTLNAVPINNTMLSFDLIKPWENLQTDRGEDEYPEKHEFPVITLLSETEEQMNNPHVLDIEFSSSLELTTEDINYLKEHTQVTLFDYKESKILALGSIEISDTSWFGNMNEATGEWVYKIQLNVSAENLNVFIGDYQLTLSITDDLWQMNEKVDTTFTYMPEFTYEAAIPTVDTNQVYTQVYYLNASKEFLVPVTKKLGSSSKFIRNTISTLSYDIPDDAEIFAQDVKAPRLPRVYLNKGVLSCYLNRSDMTDFKSGSPENKLIALALVKTLTDIGYVDNITFYVNNNQNGTFINNLPLKTIYNEDFSTYAYLNYYDNNGRSFLVPQEIDGGQDTVEDLINILQTTHKAVENGGLIAATLPRSVTLINKKQESNTLTLTFSDSLLSVYADMPTAQAMMMDSLVQTLTSLPAVDKLVIQTESQSTETIGNVTLGTPVASNRFLNPIR